MSRRRQRLTVFPDARSLLQGLHGAVPPPRRFPERVWQIGSGTSPGYAVPRQLLGEGFDALARQYGWAIEERAATSADREIPLVRLLASVDWRPVGTSGAPDGGGAAFSAPFDAGNPRIRYLLVARNQEHAGRLLEGLTSFLVRGIHAVPLTAESDSELSFFWWVDAGRQPPMPVLRAASRVYWGPVVRDDFLWIFKQWPWDLALPDELLRRLPWEEDNGMVLLAREAPEICWLRPGEAGRAWTELTRVAELRAGTYAEARVCTEPNETAFRVDLRLVSGNAETRLERRIRELEREVRAKEQILESLRDQLDHAPASAERVPQLLYIYRESDGRRVPAPLRRLLIDWSGSAEEIATLRYAKLDGASLPGRHRRSGSHLHLLTTAAAITRPTEGTIPAPSPAIGWRLEEYAPRRGENTRFVRQDRWAASGLALFLPSGQDLVLYPEVAPSELNAQRLATALLGGAGRRGHELALLFADVDHPLAVWRIPFGTFRPLTDERGWNCSVEVESMAPGLTASLVGNVRSTFVDSLGQALTLAVTEERDQRLTPIHRGLQQRLDTEARRVDRRLQDVQALTRRLDAFDRTVATSLEQLEVSASVLRDETAPLNSLLDRHRDEVRNLNDVTARLREARADMQSMDLTIRGLRQQIRQLSANRRRGRS